MNKLLSKYREFPAPVKASFWFVIANVLTKGISFITLPIFSRILTTSEYGVTSVYYSWVSIISILSTLTVWGGVFNIAMVNYPDQKNKIISSFQGLAVTITIGFFAVALIFLNPVSKIFGLPKILTIAVFIEILAQIPYNLWTSRQRFEYKYKATIAVSIISTIANPLFGYFAVISATHKAEARVLVGVAVQLIIGMICFITNEIKGHNFFDKELWSFAAKFNIVLVPHYLAMQVLNQSDRLMINRMCGSSDAGIYSVAYNFAMLLTLITTGINSSFTPYIYQSIKNNNEKRLAKQANGVVLIIAIMALALICIVPDVFKWMLPESYYPAIWVIPPVTAGAFFMFLYPLFGSVEFYYKENRYVTAASLVGAVANIILNYIFIKIFGFIAAAYTTLACYALFSICHYIFMKKVLIKNGIDSIPYDMKTITVISIAVIIISIAMTVLYNNSYVRWGVIVMLLVSCFAYRRKIIETIQSIMKKGQ